jgi:hypothetical protein
MKLLTKDLIKKLPKIYEQQNLEDQKVFVKLFTPWSHWTWYIMEYDEDTQECFGLLGGFEKELGYFSLDELADIKGPFGLRVERDKFFEPCLRSEIK